ncbi:MAG: hypothetical protein M1281_18800 [Chloroflexi bacterium]|nr:hypothetical protein [Chloroflexota bacterium]
MTLGRSVSVGWPDLPFYLSAVAKWQNAFEYNCDSFQTLTRVIERKSSQLDRLQDLVTAAPDMNEFSPLDRFSRALDYWWLIVILTIAGGVAGWGIHRLLLPEYEARAVISVSINYSQTGQLTQFEEDRALDMVGGLVQSTPVLDAIAKQAQASQIQVSAADLTRMGFWQRNEYVWVLKLRSRSPTDAQTLTNLWADEAYHQLNTAYQHALNAQNLQRYLNSLESCLSNTAASRPVLNPCNMSSLADLQTQLQSTGTAMYNELKASRGISPALSFDLSQKASLPVQPAAYGMNSLVLAGALIGFVVGIWLVNNPQALQLVGRLRRG